jgi:hypothetical protein
MDQRVDRRIVLFRTADGFFDEFCRTDLPSGDQLRQAQAVEVCVFREGQGSDLLGEVGRRFGR